MKIKYQRNDNFEQGYKCRIPEKHIVLIIKIHEMARNGPFLHIGGQYMVIGLKKLKVSYDILGINKLEIEDELGTVLAKIARLLYHGL